MNRVKILGLAFSVVIVTACEKSVLVPDARVYRVASNEVHNSVNRVNINNGENRYVDLEEYMKIIALGTIDLMDDELFLSTLNEFANTAIIDSDDYYAYYKNIETEFSKNGRSLYNEMLKSLINNGGSESQIKIFKTKRYMYFDGSYSYEANIMMPYMNKDVYTNVDMSKKHIIAAILANRDENGNFLVWEKDIHNNIVEKRENHSIIEVVPTLVINARIISLKLKDVIDTKFYVAAGKCIKSTATDICNVSGKKCKCEDGGPIDIIRNELINLLK